MALPLVSKIAIGTVFAGAATYLVASDTGEGVLEYMYVEKLAASPDQFAGRRIKVHGLVVEGSVKRKTTGAPDYRFVVEHEGARLPVHYTAEVPDTFAEGGEVVLTGTLELGSGVFESDEMSAKCPSKYEAQQDPLAGKAG